MRNLRQVLVGLDSANRGQISVEELMQNISGCGRHVQERPVISRQGAVLSFYCRYQRTKNKRLRDKLGSTFAAHHQ